MKPTNSVRWTRIVLTTLAILVLVLSSGWNPSALAEEIQLQDVTDIQGSNGRMINEPSKWYSPPEFRSNDHELDINLTVEEKDYEFKFEDKGFSPSITATLRSYTGTCKSGNCQSTNTTGTAGTAAVGPTLRVKAGEILKVHLSNQLPGNDDSNCVESTTEDKLHCFNTTNLHTHGLHISPKEHSDNVLLSIKPQQNNQFKFEIPKKHHPGTHWYHAHHHGSTAVQLASGMAGALIVEDPQESTLPEEIKNADDRIFVFQQLAFDAEGKVQERGDEAMQDTLDHNFRGHINNEDTTDNRLTGPRKYTTINGTQKPLIQMEKGKVERWRFIHAGVFETLNIGICKQTALLFGNNPGCTNSSSDFLMREIALDGIYLKEVREVPSVFMAPGYRADVMVKAPQIEGDYYLYKIPKGSQKLPRYYPADEKALKSEQEILAVIQVSGECESSCDSSLPEDGTPIPQQYRPEDIMKLSITGTDRRAEFTRGLTINNKKFDSNRVDYCLKQDDIEEWTLSSGGSHPFHIHVNPFQVVDPGDSGAKKGDWHDTIWVQGGEDPKEIKFRTHYEDFDGQFVLHCHILDHEDRGMMSLVQIIESGKDCTVPSQKEEQL